MTASWGLFSDVVTGGAWFAIAATLLAVLRRVDEASSIARSIQVSRYFAVAFCAAEGTSHLARVLLDSESHPRFFRLVGTVTVCAAVATFVAFLPRVRAIAAALVEPQRAPAAGMVSVSDRPQAERPHVDDAPPERGMAPLPEAPAESDASPSVLFILEGTTTATATKLEEAIASGSLAERAATVDEASRVIHLRRPDAIVAHASVAAAVLAAASPTASARAIPVLLLLDEPSSPDAVAEPLPEGAADYFRAPLVSDVFRVRLRNVVDLARARAALDEVRLARDAAHKESELKSSFVALVSHELRTPLTSLQLLVDRLMDKREALPERQTKIIERIGTSSTRLADLVDSLLHYTRIQSGRVDANVEPFDLNALARATVEELRLTAERKALVLSADASTDRILVESDPQLVRLVVLNLISNAIKFTDVGSVSVEVAAEGDRRIVRVTDTGRGIDAAADKRIFEPFSPEEPTHRKHLPGIGLGLSLARRIVDNLGGRISFRSELGKGSTFEVSLPAAVRKARGLDRKVPWESF